MLDEAPRVVAVEARPPVVPVAAGPSRVTTDVTMIGVGVSPARVAEGVTVTTEVAISVVVGGADEAVTTEVATGGALDGAGAALDGAGAAEEGAAEVAGGAEDAGAADDAGGADEAGGADDAGAELAGGAELGAAEEAGSVAEEGVLGAADEGATDDGA